MPEARVKRSNDAIQSVQSEMTTEAEVEYDMTEGTPEEERWLWMRASEPSFARIWDNEMDAVYDNWRELYPEAEEGTPTPN